MDPLSSSGLTAPGIDDHFQHNMWYPLWNYSSSSTLMVLLLHISWKATWPRSHSLVTLILIYFVTRRRCLPLHDDTWSTTVHRVPYVSVTPLPPCSGRVSRVASTLWFTLLCFFSLVLSFFSSVSLYPYVAVVWTVTIYQKNDTLCSSGPGTTSGRTSYPKKLRRWSASMLFWVKLICSAGVSSLCAMEFTGIGASIVFCPSEESPQTSTHSSTNTFFKESLVGILLTYCRACWGTVPLPWGSQVLEWQHCHHVIASS